MEILQLKYFCDAAKCENFSRTAKKFGVPPSDISQSIRRLERELGVSLFVRRANSIELNDKGREFYSRALKALAILDDAVAAVKESESTGKIKICINSNRRIVMDVIEKYRRIYPEVEIVTTHFTSPDTDDFDMIIESTEDGFSGYNKSLLINEPILVAIQNGNPLAAYDKIDVSSLENEAFVSMSERSSLYSLTNSICRDFGFAPKIAMQSDDPFYVRKCVELGLGICFAPAFSWYGLFSDSVALKRVEGYTRNTYVFTNPKKHVSLCAKRFLDMLLEEAKSETRA